MSEVDVSDLYVKDDLADYADVTAIESDDSYGLPNRSELLSTSLGVEPTVISSGGYQGTMLFILVVGERLWLITDSYGSCSYCDGLLAQGEQLYRAETDEEKNELLEQETENLRQYAESMMNNGYAFTSVNDAVRFLNEKDCDGGHSYHHGWCAVASDGIAELRDVEL